MFRAGVIEILTSEEICSHHVVHVDISATHFSRKVLLKLVHVGLEEEVTELVLGPQEDRDSHLGKLVLIDKKFLIH